MLVFDLSSPLQTRFGLLQGTYCYVGSAFGPGGIQARLGRHLRKHKKVSWHLDIVTNSDAFAPLAAFATDRRIECAIAAALSSRLEACPGFGCSDCSCQSHLFRVMDLQAFRCVVQESGLRELDRSLLARPG